MNFDKEHSESSELDTNLIKQQPGVMAIFASPSAISPLSLWTKFLN